MAAIKMEKKKGEPVWGNYLVCKTEIYNCPEFTVRKGQKLTIEEIGREKYEYLKKTFPDWFEEKTK